MDTRNRTRIAPLLLAFAAATLVIGRPSAQGGRPPDITGNWRLDNAEDPGQPKPGSSTVAGICSARTLIDDGTTRA